MKTLGTILMIAIGFFFNTKIETPTAADDIAKRQTVAVLHDVKGEVRKIGEEDIYMIYCVEKHLKLNPVNLPQQYKKPGISITFSGNIKRMDAMEDEWGELFEVTAVK